MRPDQLDHLVKEAAFAERVTEEDVAISRDGRVMKVLSEHACHGWLEGYTLTARHGWFATYEAWCEQQLLQHERHVVEHLQDMPEVRDWSLGDWAEKG
jgi:xylulose-5-phosphate/fructose-6-phosphate phosphoketolase